MRCVKYTITTAQLNTGSEVTLELPIEGFDKGYDVIFYPRSFISINNNLSSSAVIGILMLSEGEEEERESYPERFDFIPLQYGQSKNNISQSKKFILKKLSGTATANIDLYFTNYNLK